MSNRLPSAHAFASLSPVDQGALLDWHRRQLDDEEATFTRENLKSGCCHLHGMTFANFRRSLRSRRTRLEKLAAKFGFGREGEGS